MGFATLTAIERVDRDFYLVFGIAFSLLLLITVLMVSFVIRYRASRHPTPAEISANWRLEVVWTLIPTLIVLVIFSYGWDSYMGIRGVPRDAMEVKVIGRMFSWTFEYPQGRQTQALIVPAGRAVLLTLTSEDVIHSLFIPAFRLKKDAVPGMRTQAWFQPRTPGTFELFCAAYCGPKHYDMTADVVVVPPERFAAWSAGKVETSALLSSTRAAAWAALPPGVRVLQKYGCLKCHSLDGRRDVGPTFKGLAGQSVQVVRDGQRLTVTADAEYLKRSISDPHADLRVGYDALMPAYTLSEAEMSELLDYFKSLR
jgi:cytochrome c oxidase subunit II